MVEILEVDVEEEGMGMGNHKQMLWYVDTSLAMFMSCDVMFQ